MKLLITRPAFVEEGSRAFVPGLTVDVDEPTAQMLLARQAAIVIEAAESDDHAPSRTSRSRKSADHVV